VTSIIHPVILCGGSGARLWPLSTPEVPKQFLALTSSKSMIEETVARFDKPLHADLDFAQPLVVGSTQHRSLLSAKLGNMRKILEPVGRNSAPAVAAACMVCDREDLILILPADHNIRDVKAFHNAIATAAQPAEAGSIVTFGIEPTHPATEYGYIKTNGSTRFHDATPVVKFKEKPDLATARTYIDAGEYFWNAGIFLFKASVMLDALEEYAPEVLAGTRKAMANNTDDPIYLKHAEFSATPSISIDYAVLERAENVKVVPVSMGWSDVGGYRALHELATKNESENYTSGAVHIQNCNGSYIRSEGPAVLVNGASNLIVVATNDKVMITSINNDAAVIELSAAFENQRVALGVSPELRAQIRGWLWDALDLWSTTAWDDERGGFVEKLDLKGAPDMNANRRVRVHARQVFSFSKAIEIGWPEERIARNLVDAGIEYLDSKLRHPRGGWVHRVAADGTPLDAKRDLYDHAFIILAGSTAYKVTGSQRALKVSRDAIDFIDNELKDHQYGGWLEGMPATLPRRANPHMHLLEAMLAYHDATECEKALSRAAEIVRLFETRFFNASNDIMAELFSEDWQLITPASETRFEPGHHYEWATLLYKYELVTGHDTLSWRRRLILRANKTGINPKTGFPYNSLRADDQITNPNSRLWPALEKFRAHMTHPSLSPVTCTERQFRDISNAYLNKGPNGGWFDEIDADGKPTAKAVPASMLYHVIKAFA